jgi:hypothetical protein
MIYLVPHIWVRKGVMISPCHFMKIGSLMVSLSGLAEKVFSQTNSRAADKLKNLVAFFQNTDEFLMSLILNIQREARKHE